MLAPIREDISALWRVSRYLLSAPRLVNEFPWSFDSNLDVSVDTDFALSLATRRSTSGGAAMRGLHLVKHLSSTQKAVTWALPKQNCVESSRAPWKCWGSRALTATLA